MSKEAIKNILIAFICDYDPNKWSNDDVYDKYAEKIDKVRSMGEIIAVTELTKKVADLEAKLAEQKLLADTILKSYVEANKSLGEQLLEKETRIAELEDKDWYEGLIKQLEDQCGRLLEERDNAKQQLALKETDLSLARNEINTLKHNLKIAQEHDKVMCEQLLEMCNGCHQDKISFALEQLEHLKTKLEQPHLNGNPQKMIRLGKVLKTINNTLQDLREKYIYVEKRD